IRTLVDELTPTVQAAAARGLLRSNPLGRSIRQEVADLSQDFFLVLFANGGKALRAWDPKRGRTLQSWVRLLAEHQVSDMLSTQRRHPWSEEPLDLDDLEAEGPIDEGPEIELGSLE